MDREWIHSFVELAFLFTYFNRTRIRSSNFPFAPGRERTLPMKHLVAGALSKHIALKSKEL
jgi:hypothetical protein